jgi:hypothetical protein
MQRLILLVFLSVSLVCAQGVTTSLPQLAFGGGWNTSFTIVNLSDLPGQGELRFHAEDGTPLNVILNSSSGQSVSSASIMVPPHGVQTIQTLGSGDTTIGWADFVADTTTAPLSISSVYSRQLNQNMTFEASVPGVVSATKPLIIPFDNTANFSTGLAVVNPSAIQAATIPVTIRDANGVVTMTDSLTLNPGAHMSFSLASKYSMTAGQMGTIEFDPDLTGGGLNVVAFRFNPTGAFTTVQPVSRQ